MNRCLTALVAIICFCGPALGRDKTDVIHLINGDRVTGEIKKLEYGKLRISTDSMGTIQIEWEDIATVSSAFGFEFEISDGARFFGTLEEGAEPAVLIIATRAEPTMLSFAQVIRITPIEDSFLDRLSGSLSLGYNFTKASGVSQSNFTTAVTHRTRERAITLSAVYIATSDQANVTTERHDLSTTITHFWTKRRWFNSWIAGAERNDELGVDLRLSLGGGVGKYLIQNNVSELALLAGALITRESLAAGRLSDRLGENPGRESLEGLLGLGYKRYIFDDPNVDVSTQLTINPSLTEKGRVRAQLDARIRYELVSDLFLDLTLYDSYDSDPPLSAQSTNDYGIVTSLGWSF